MGGIEVVNGNGEVADAGFLHGGGLGHDAVGGDDLEHGAVRSFDEVENVIAEIDVESEIVHVPLGELARVRRCDGGVFEALEHKLRF
jgi:hypothetical protein